jgi:hypothetical protein
VKEESTTYDSVAWGRQLGGEREANWLGDLDSHTRAYPERVAQARQYFTENPFDSLTVVKTGPDRFSLVDAEGTELLSAGFDPLQSSTPASSGIVGFTVDHGNRLLYLQRRGESTIPASSEVLVWSVTERTVTA